MRLDRARLLAAAGVAATWTILGCAPKPARFEEPPNILLIVVDTLRADHLPFHGYERNTAPRLTELMSAGGVQFDNAYAPSSWTAPSVAAILTGKDPSRLVASDNLHSFGIPREESTLAERLAEAGYDTAAFVGNLLINQGAGYGQGFRDFWIVPGGFKSIPEPADRVLDPALAWIDENAGGERPFFIYAHFMDPHDPYTSPDLEDGRSEFYPRYDGPIRGTDVHGLNSGLVRLSENPEADIRHLRALYDSEIKYVDRAVGRLIEAAERSSKRPTLVAFTSDHGEEIFDHGGWGHARTVYEESIHVPLLFRVAGLVPGGARARENVEVVGIGRTILAAAGLPADDLDGENLLPVILGESSEPRRRPVFVRHWQRGPIRAALIQGPRRSLVYNRKQPFAPTSALESHLWREDEQRLDRFAAFDLGRDPAQTDPQVPAPDDLEKAFAHLDPSLDGLRFVLRGLDEGTQVSGRLTFSRPPSSVLPLFLMDSDDVKLAGNEVRFQLLGEVAPKGFLLVGDPGALTSIEIEPDEALEIEIGRGNSWSGRPLETAALRRPSWPAWSGRPSLRIWSRESRATAPGRPLDEETRGKLQALGYL